jgi:glycine betaine transporter
MIVPTVFSLLFATTLGGTAIHMQLFENIPLVETVAKSIEATLFETLRHLPLYAITAVIANLLIASFFITSADSATFVITRFSQGHDSSQDSAVCRPLVIFWGIILGVLALVLIFSGGLKALQTASIVGALPFVLVIYFLLISLTRELIAEKQHTSSR